MRLEYKWQATLIVAMGLFMAVLDNTVVNVALPSIDTFFHAASYNDVVWVATAYFLAQAAVIPAVGNLSDIFGSKIVFLIGLFCFTLGSGLCVIAPNLGFLIAFRVFQGLGGGALLPIVYSIAFKQFPPYQRGMVSATIGVPVLLAPAFGPTIGGYLTSYFDWRAIFMVNLPIGVLVFLLGTFILKGRAAEQQSEIQQKPASQVKKPFDFLGLFLAMSGVTSLVYGISLASINGWTDQTVRITMITGAGILAIFILVELFVAKDPVMDLKLFRHYSFSVGNILIGFIGAFFFGSVMLFPIFFQNGLGYSPLNSGEIFILQGLTTTFGVFLSGRLYNKIGPRALVALGIFLVAISSFGLTNLSMSTTGWSIQGWLVLRGFGFGITNTPLQTFILSRVENAHLARASSLVSVMRQIFSAIGVAWITTYFAQQANTHGQAIAQTTKAQLAAHPPTGAAAQCITQFSAHGQTAISNCIGNYIATNALVAGVNDTFTIVMYFLFIGAIIALFIGRDINVQKLKQSIRSGLPTEQQASIQSDRDEIPMFAGE